MCLSKPTHPPPISISAPAILLFPLLPSLTRHDCTRASSPIPINSVHDRSDYRVAGTNTLQFPYYFCSIFIFLLIEQLPPLPAVARALRVDDQHHPNGQVAAGCVISQSSGPAHFDILSTRPHRSARRYHRRLANCVVLFARALVERKHKGRKQN